MEEELTIIARVLKRVRRERGWTLADVAQRSGISTATLSKVERGCHSLTYEKIIDLARGLEVEIGSLFQDSAGDPGGSGRRSLTRSGDGVHYHSGSNHSVYLNTDLLRKKFYPVVYEITARSLREYGPMAAHDGEQLVYVLEGELEIHTEFYEPVRLYQGDAFYFDSSMRHAAFKIGDVPCRLFGVLSALDTGGTDAIQASRSHDVDQRREPAALPKPQRRSGAGRPVRSKSRNVRRS